MRVIYKHINLRIFTFAHDDKMVLSVSKGSLVEIKRITINVLWTYNSRIFDL